MKKLFFTNTILPTLAILLLLPLNFASARTFNNDFETGDLTDWEKTGTAFDFQPTWGDNPTARNRGQPSEHQGDWWLGLAEKYQGPVKGKALGQNPGDLADGVDAPQGTLTSMEFTIVGETMNFLIGSGNRAWDTAEPCCVNLVIDEKVERTMTGNNTETMTRQEWMFRIFRGRSLNSLLLITVAAAGDTLTLTMSIKPIETAIISLGRG